MGIKAKKQPVPFFKRGKDGRWYHWREYVGDGDMCSDLNPLNWIKEEIKEIGRMWSVFDTPIPAQNVKPGDVIYAPGVKNPTVTAIEKTGSAIKLVMGNNTIPHNSIKTYNDPVFVVFGLGINDIEIDDIKFTPGKFDIELGF